MYVFEHLHIPFTVLLDGVLLVNPGAVASGNAFCRQTVQSVAVLELDVASEPRVGHHRLDVPGGSIPAPVGDDGLAAALAAVSESIVDADIREAWRLARFQDPDVRRAFEELLLVSARRRRAGAAGLIDGAEMLEEAERQGVARDVRESLAALFKPQV